MRPNYTDLSIAFPLPFSNINDGVHVPSGVPFALYDSIRPNYSNPTLLHHLLSNLWANRKSLFLFLDADELMSQAAAKSLMLLMVNCVAAFSARSIHTLSHVAEVHTRVCFTAEQLIIQRPSSSARQACSCVSLLISTSLQASQFTPLDLSISMSDHPRLRALIHWSLFHAILYTGD